MRKFLTILLLLATAPMMCAELSEKAMKKIIIECDVADTVLNAPDSHAFWVLLQYTNREYYKTSKSLASNGDRDIKRELISVLSNCDQYFRTVPTRTDLYELSESLTETSGIRSVAPTATLTVTDDSDIATFGYPNGYIFFTDGLYRAVDGDSVTLSALLAAEGAHYALQHAYAHQKYEKKRRNRQRFWRIFGAVAITGASIALDNATDGDFPAEIGIATAVGLASLPVEYRYKMQYTPRQIHEADIVAYRFCQNIYGSGNPYISALYLVGNDLDATSAHSVEAPSVAERIALLQYMERHPELRSKIKANHTKPRRIKNMFNPFSPSNYR